MYKLICLVLAFASVSMAAKLEGKQGKNGSAHGHDYHNHHDHHHDHNVTCKGEPVKNLKTMEEDYKQCMQQLHPKMSTTSSSVTMSPEETKKAHMKRMKENMQDTCIDVCVWKKHQLLKPDGTYDATVADKLVKTVFPQAVQSDMKKALDDCAAANRKAFSMDNKCEGYKAFKMCKLAKMAEICGFSKPEHNKKA